ncbi:MAG: F0F1 ATP synthase subunit delta, partial [candidate division WOR-3 bacterium]
MIRHAIAKRYAKALFSVGEKDMNYRKYLEELNALIEAVEAEPRLKTTLMLPLLEMEKRRDLLSDVVRVLGQTREEALDLGQQPLAYPRLELLVVGAAPHGPGPGP